MTCSLEWRPVAGFEDRYDVSSDGVVRSKNGTLLTARINSKGQRIVVLYKEGRQRTTTVARLMGVAFLAAKPSDVVDHINRVKTDDRLSNLRLASIIENAGNTGPRRAGTSGFKGVSWFKLRSKWRATFNHAGKQKHIGYFECPVAAARAYDAAAKAALGDFAFLNFPL